MNLAISSWLGCLMKHCIIIHGKIIHGKMKLYTRYTYIYVLQLFLAEAQRNRGTPVPYFM
jgi:hypothetical protein